MPHKKILIIKGISRYNVLKKAADEAAEGFNACGYDTVIRDLTVKEQNDRFIEELPFLDQRYHFVFSFQAIYMTDYFVENVFPKTRLPFFGWVVDDIIYHNERFGNMLFPWNHLFTIDEEMTRLAGGIFPDTKNIYTLFHGGFKPPEKFPEKDIDILFPGMPGKIPKWTVEPPMPVEDYLANEALKVLKEKPFLSVYNALKTVLDSLGESFTPDLISSLSNTIMYVSDLYRYQCRLSLLETLAKSHMCVHVLGEGQHEVLQEYSENIIYHGACDIGKTLSLMARAKIIINPIPAVFEKGFHERIFTSMLYKAACFSPFTHYGKEKLGNRIEWIDMNSLQDMITRIHTILSDWDTYKNTVLEDNYSYALTNHTWKRRGMQIIDFYENNFDPAALAFPSVLGR